MNQFSKILTISLYLALGFSLSACSTMLSTKARPSGGAVAESRIPYEQEIDRFSRGDTEYAGLYNNFEFKATILNSEIRNAVLEKRASSYQWDATKFAAEREKSLQEMSTATSIFLAFFTPDNRNDNLTDVKSIWRIYLDAGGRRYEGKIKRIRLLVVEIQAMYPYYTRWTTPYEVTFDVPTAAIETQTSKLTITGPLGTRSIEFPAL